MSGKRIAQKMEQEEKNLLSTVTDKLKESLNNNNNNGDTTGTFLASALQSLTATISMAFKME